LLTNLREDALGQEKYLECLSGTYDDAKIMLLVIDETLKSASRENRRDDAITAYKEVAQLCGRDTAYLEK